MGRRAGGVSRIVGASMVDRPRRIVFLITSSGMGGAERQVRLLAPALHRRGWRVGVISMLPLEAPIAELPGLGIPTRSLDMRRGLADPRAMLRLARILRRWRPDVVHAHMFHASLLARLSRLVVGTPVVISTMHSENQGAQWRYRVYRLTDGLSDVTTAVSSAVLDQAVHRGAVRADRIRVVRNGIDVSASEADPTARLATRTSLGLGDSFAWLAVGRFVEAKDYPNLIDAFGRARGSHPAARLLIAGSGPLEADLRGQIATAGLDSSVALLGLRSDVVDLMRAADGFVMASAWEGLPMVLLEAAASRLPIVVTDVGGCRDVVENGVTGLLVPPHDSDQLGRAMDQLMAMPPAERGAMGSAAAERVRRNFDLGAVVEIWESVYTGALGLGSDRAPRTR